MTSPPVRIVPFDPTLAPHFRRLNLDWIERLFTVEPPDLAVLVDPEGAVMAGGGEVFFALVEGAVVGCCAAVNEGDGRWELSKMAVDPAAQGRGIGELLARAAVTFIRVRQPRELYLVTNSSLHTAIRLYQRIGFEHRPMPPDNHYARGDVYMVHRSDPDLSGASSAPD